MRKQLVLCLVLLTLAACAYRRHTTLLQTVPNPPQASQELPRGMFSFTLLRAEALQGKMSGLPWDDDGTGPDPFVRLYVDGRKVWESETKQNIERPEWNVRLPRNVVIPSDSDFRLELWDWDTAISADPMGRLERRGLPTNVVPGAQARVTLDSNAVIEVMVNHPVPHRGVGLEVELRSDFLKVIVVERHSPAARAGIRVGDQIVAIGAERVSAMGEDESASALSLAVDRGSKLSVRDSEGRGEHEVSLDKGYVWLVM